MPDALTPLPDQLIEAVTWHDEQTRAKRVDRMRWSSSLKPEAGLVFGKPEPLAVLEDARASFVNEYYVAAIMTATAYIDHALGTLLSRRKFKPQENTLSARIRAARRKKILTKDVLNRIDTLRKIRNPFAHEMPSDHPMNLGNRVQSEARHPQAILEDDAKEALTLMYVVYAETLMKVKLSTS
ncbi:hypothetical protein ACN9MZ_27340 [Pseudoduganella sp. S-14]|uniref:hypothetical protein n=1 Tax=Pseudoduganella sp. S-14 TaxID=3404065 RepID=UPI003CE6CA10